MTIGEEIYNKLFEVSRDKSYYGKIQVYKSECVEIINNFLFDLQIKNSTLEAKITAYEAILKNSNFAMAVIEKPLSEPPTDPDLTSCGHGSACPYYPDGCGKCTYNNP